MSDYERIKEAIGFIAQNAERQPSLEEVASHVGLSPQHFQRLFTRWAGVSPKRYVQHLTASRATELLRESKPAIDAAFSVGLSGPGRLHDLTIAAEGATPGELRSGGENLRIVYGTGESPFGTCFIASTGRGLCALRFTDFESEEDVLSRLRVDWPRARFERDDVVAAALIAEVFEEGAGEARLAVRGTNFQLRVWEALLRIPEGCVVSYGDLAARLGEPTASRAVANAVGANPVAYLIPCHRVLRASGALGGYRWGTERKVVMLERELARTRD